MIEQDPMSRVACETARTTGQVLVMWAKLHQMLRLIYLSIVRKKQFVISDTTVMKEL